MTTASTSGTASLNAVPGCTTCTVCFNSKEAQRVHMKGDWHIYNMKRRIASLPPISESIFNEKVAVSDIGSSDGETNWLFNRSCPACEQGFTSRRSWNIHLKTRNHANKTAQLDLQRLNRIQENDQSAISHRKESQDSEAEETANPLWCLFCNVTSTSLDVNLSHMSNAHNFFIPDIDFLIDVESFLSYLSAIIFDFHECLYCGSLRSTKSATQAHMRGKGHCKLDFKSDELELKQFFDFPSDESDVSDGNETKERILDDDELRLPSGKIVAHRSRGRGSRPRPAGRSLSASHKNQRLLTEAGSDLEAEAEPEPETETSNREILDRRLALRAGTSSSLVGLPEAEIRALIAVERKMERVGERTRNHFQRMVERGGNRQKRFRVLTMGKKAGGLEKRLG